jgi:hypothetical protein
VIKSSCIVCKTLPLNFYFNLTYEPQNENVLKEKQFALKYAFQNTFKCKHFFKGIVIRMRFNYFLFL